MQESTEVAALTDNNSRFPTAKCLINWDKSYTTITWFRCDEPNVDRGYLVTDRLYTELETPEGIITEVDSVKYIDESNHLMQAEGLDELYGDDYQSVSSECDIKLENTTDRFTPQDGINIIIRNPGFESYGLFGWNTISGSGDIIETSGGQYDGDACLKVQNIAHIVDTGVYCDLYPIGSGNGLISSGADYIGSIYASGNGTLYVRINITDSGNTVLDYEEDSFVLTDNYQRCTVPITIDGVSEGRGRKMNMQTTISGDVAYLDDAQIELGSVPTAFDNDFIGDFIIPKRIVRINTGFKNKPNDLSGADVIQFTGANDEITPNIRDDVVDIHCLDLSGELKDITATPNMYVDYLASDLIKLLAYQANLTDAQMVIDESAHVVRFAWFQTGSIWYYMQMLAEAEGGRIFFDKQGVLRFWNKNHDFYSNTAVRTFSFDDISNLSYSISSRKMKNRIIVKSLPRSVCSFQKVYNHPTVVKLIAGESQEIWANINDENNRDLPCLSLTQPVAGADWRVTSSFTANSQQDNEGTDLNGFVSITSWYAFGKDAKMVFKNNASVDAYLTDITIFGIPARVIGEGIEVIVEDTDLINEFGAQELQIENNFIDDEYFADSLASFRLDELKDPTKFIDIDVVGDVRLEPGDKINCQMDYDGNYDVFKIVRNRWQLINDFMQTLSLEKVFIDSWFTADQSIADGFDICMY